MYQLFIKRWVIWFTFIAQIVLGVLYWNEIITDLFYMALPASILGWIIMVMFIGARTTRNKRGD